MRVKDHYDLLEFDNLVPPEEMSAQLDLFPVDTLPSVSFMQQFAMKQAWLREQAMRGDNEECEFD